VVVVVVVLKGMKGKKLNNGIGIITVVLITSTLVPGIIICHFESSHSLYVKYNF